MSDLELELLSFMGTDFGASIVAEIGEECVRHVFMAGAMAQELAENATGQWEEAA